MEYGDAIELHFLIPHDAKPSLLEFNFMLFASGVE